MVFYEACITGNVELVENYFCNKIDLDKGLEIAAKKGYRDVCNILISRGALVSFDTLKYVVCKGYFNTTKDLAKAYIKVNGFDRNKFDNLLDLAIEGGYRRTIKSLREAVRESKK